MTEELHQHFLQTAVAWSQQPSQAEILNIKIQDQEHHTHLLQWLGQEH